MVVQVLHEPVDQPGFGGGRLDIDCGSVVAWLCAGGFVEVELKVRGTIVLFGDIVGWVGNPDAVILHGHDGGSVNYFGERGF